VETDFFVFGAYEVVDDVRTGSVASTVAKPFFAVREVATYNAGGVVYTTVTTSMTGQLLPVFFLLVKVLLKIQNVHPWT